MPSRLLTILATSSLLFLVAGCPKKSAVTVSEKPKGPPRVSQEVINKAHPNEAGAALVIMYHRFLSNEPDNDLNRRPESFRRDLQTLHAKGYYPVNASDFVTNTMNVPAGKTPVVLTFDDSLPSQFKVVLKDGKASISPDSAVGILETFSKNNKDWPLRGTFFVLPKEGRNNDSFGQAEYVADKYAYLTSKGYEIANHTSTHNSLRRKSAKEVEWELATAKKDILSLSDNKATMQTLALPYGQLPRDAAARKALMAGSSGGTSYQNKAVFLAAWRPVLSPLTKNDKKWTDAGSLSPFDVTGLERVKPDARRPNEPGTLEYWLKYFDRNPTLRYISDGNLGVAAIPISDKPKVDESNAKAQGKVLQFYGGAQEKGAGGGLSVD